MKRETLTWLATGVLFTERCENAIGRQCRHLSIKQVAENNRTGWAQAQRMAIAYMKRVVAANPISQDLRAIGIDEVSVKKGHKYRIAVSDLDARRPIWMGGDGRTEQDLERFFVEIGSERCQKIQIVVMDMWKPFRKVAAQYVPHARIIFDKFHIIRHLADALDQVRRQEYKRVSDKERDYIKGQRYTLLSHKANLDEKGRRSLKLLLKANKRPHKAYLLKESFGQLWDYSYPASTQKFFENWKAQLRWQKLEPENLILRFAVMV